MKIVPAVRHTVFLHSGSFAADFCLAFELLFLDFFVSGAGDCYPLSFVPCNASDQDQLLTRVPSQPGVLRSVTNTNPRGGCLDVFGGPVPNRGQRVGLYTCDGGANQQWIVNGSTLVEVRLVSALRLFLCGLPSATIFISWFGSALTPLPSGV